jgi:hypothetical protein
MVRGWAAALVVTALAGCQTLPPPVPEQAPARHQLDVPFHRQSSTSAARPRWP